MKKYLLEITTDDPDIIIEEIDIISSPKQCLANGIRMIPAIVVGQDKLSGVFLTKKAIREFINNHKD